MGRKKYRVWKVGKKRTERRADQDHLEDSWICFALSSLGEQRLARFSVVCFRLFFASFLCLGYGGQVIGEPY